MTLINRTPTSVLYRYNVGIAVSTQTLVTQVIHCAAQYM